MSRFQKFILGGFAFIALLLLVGTGVIIWSDISKVSYLPTETNMILPASFFETLTSIKSPIESRVATTEPMIPTTRKMLPTWTPISSNTPIPSFTAVLSKTIAPTPRRAAATTAPSNRGSYCSAQYKYIEELHQYYLDYINASYGPTLSYYDSLMQEAAGNRDVGEMIRLKREIERVKADRDSAINSENSRYASDRAYLDSQCK
jgi:hypothetical protein